MPRPPCRRRGLYRPEHRESALLRAGMAGHPHACRRSRLPRQGRRPRADRRMHRTGAAGSCAGHRTSHQPDHDRRIADVSQDGLRKSPRCAAAFRRALCRLHQSAVSPMLYLAIAFPVFDPIAISLGPIAIRWYALAYIGGIVLGWIYARALIKSERLWGGPAPISLVQMDDFILWVTVGIIVGGRSGYVLFYNLPFFIEHPAAIFKLWEGGRSFH